MVLEEDVVHVVPRVVHHAVRIVLAAAHAVVEVVDGPAAGRRAAVLVARAALPRARAGLRAAAVVARWRRWVAWYAGAGAGRRHPRRAVGRLGGAGAAEPQQQRQQRPPPGPHPHPPTAYSYPPTRPRPPNTAGVRASVRWRLLFCAGPYHARCLRPAHWRRPRPPEARSLAPLPPPRPARVWVALLYSNKTALHVVSSIKWVGVVLRPAAKKGVGAGGVPRPEGLRPARPRRG